MVEGRTGGRKLTPRPAQDPKARQRRLKGRGSVFQRADGRWVGTLVAGTKPDPQRPGREQRDVRTVYGTDEAAVEAKLAARPRRAEMVEAPREPGLPRRLTAYYRVPSIEHVANVTVAGTPPQLVAYYQALIAAGMRYFVVSPSGDPEALRLMAEEVMPRLAGPA